MRVLLLHNRYRAEGGEERAVADIAELLERKGHEVAVLTRTSEGLPRRSAGAGMLAGGLAPAQVAAAARSLRADIVHAHNLHPLFGWRALAAARGEGARTILHLHNLRLFCAIAIGYRDGHRCFRCQGRNTLPGVRLRCRGSFPDAAVYALGLHCQQPRLLEHADGLLAVSRALADRLRGLGLSHRRLGSLPNFISRERLAERSSADAGDYALVAGRLVQEKGFDTAIRACRAARVPLRVAGEGPDEVRLRRLAAGADVEFLGWLDSAALTAVRRRAAMVLVPSRWEDPCPYAVLEAQADGVPVLGADRGGIPELLAEQRVFDPEDTDSWSAALRELWLDPRRRQQAGQRALEHVRHRFGEETYYEGLIAAYRAAGEASLR